MSAKKLCHCGCGKKLNGSRRRWAEGTRCRINYHLSKLKSGCLPLDQVAWNICHACGEVFPAWAQMKDYYRTCSSIYPKSRCAVLARGKSIQKRQKEINKKIESGKNFSRAETCFNPDQCKHYESGIWSKFACYGENCFTEKN
jgi:hypothetical protein